jgi:glycosyltransferase involved in cell wall biosynthesis
MSAQVSVIIPTYNRRAMVREAIDSVLANRGASFELIVVDDGSTDGSAEELSRLYCEREMVRVERTANRGPAAARNCGVALARAPLIAFIDSDDLWSAEKLSRHLDFMRANPECEISQTNEIWMRDGRRVNPGARHRKRSGDFFVESLRTCLISPSAVMMRTSLFKSIGGFDESMRAAEDYDLWLRILIDHEVGLLDEPLVTRRGGHRDQLSSSVSAIDRYRILALTKLLTADALANERRTAVADVLAEKCGIYAAGLKRRGRTEQARFYAEVGSNAHSKWLDGPANAIAKTIEGTVQTMRAMLARDDESQRRNSRHDDRTASAHEA